MESNKTLVIKRIEEWATMLFIYASVCELIFLTLALFITWLGQFTISYVLISLFISCLLTLLFLRSLKSDIQLIPHVNITVLFVLLIVSLILILFPHDSFGGRDEGGYSGLAIILSKYHGISVPPYLLNAPLSYGSPSQSIVFNQTTPTYVVWLATQKVLFGIDWMLKSNVVLIFLGLCSLFLVTSLLTKKSLAFVTVILFATNMPFLWFSRETMSENLAFFLLWFLILSLFLFFKTKRNYFLISLFLSSWLFSFTRNEGLFIQIPVLITLTAVLLIRKILPRKTIIFVTIIYISLIILSFFVNNRFAPLNQSPVISGTIDLFTQQLSKSNVVKLGERIPFFVFQMNSKQNLSFALYSFLLVAILVIVSKKKIVKDKILYICLLGIISVEFLKLINPSVTLEQPWIYRRFLYALLPFGYLSLSILVSNFVKQRLLIFVFCGLLIINFTLSSSILTLKNNWLITEKVAKLTQSVSTNDFVIIDGYVLGNYYPLSYIAYHKEVRNLYKWWIEIGDWHAKENKYEGKLYSKLFLLSDMEDASYKGFRLNKIDAVEVESRQLQATCDLGLLRVKLRLNFYNPAYLPYQDVIGYCSKTNNDILNIKKKLFLYEMEYNGG